MITAAANAGHFSVQLGVVGTPAKAFERTEERPRVGVGPTAVALPPNLAMEVQT